MCADCGTNAEVGATNERCARCGGPFKQRSDDSESVVRERLKVYRRDTQPLVDFYRSRPTFRSVNGAQPTDGVAADLVKAIEDASNGVTR